MKNALQLLFLCLAGSIHAATYYIDFAGGSDSNAGTAKTAPWKRHPYMVGWGGGYSQSGGDRFVFKGGVTWPRECFQFRIRSGGYYGVDKGWFNGASWTRPLFDFQHSSIGGGTAGSGVMLDHVVGVTLSGLAMKHHRGSFQPAAYNCTTLLNLGSDQVVIEDCEIANWSLPGPPPLNADPAGGSGGFACDGSYGQVTVRNCTIHQTGIGYYNGCAIKMGGQILFNEIYDVPNGIIGGGNIISNHFHHIRGATDPNAHENVILQQVPGEIRGNLIHDTEPGAEVFALNQGWVSPNRGTVILTGNIVFNTAAQTVSLYADGVASDLHFRISGNILKSSGRGYCIRAGYQNSPALGSVDARDNVFISDHGRPFCYNGAESSCGPVNAVIDQGNRILTHAQADVSGYSTTELLRRWGGGTVPGPTPPPEPPPAPVVTNILPGLSWEAEAGTITWPFVVSNSFVFQPAPSLALAGMGGKATYTFNLTNAGEYLVRGSVSADAESANSFYVGLDQEPAETMLWHVKPLTTGTSFEVRDVSWQGSGTWDASEFVPKVFALTAGRHTLVIRGREGGAKLDKVSLQRVGLPEPPPVVPLTSVQVSNATIKVSWTATTNNAPTNLSITITVP